MTADQPVTAAAQVTDTVQSRHLVHETYVKALQQSDPPSVSRTTNRVPLQHPRKSPPPPSSKTGHHLHQSSNDKAKSRIISDSTCRYIKNRTIEEQIDNSQEVGIITNHPNATAEEIGHYLEYHLKNDCPDNLVVVAGLNNVLHQKDSGNINCQDIAQKVINIGRTANQAGVARVCISGLVKPKYRDCHRYINEVNGYIWQKCKSEGFIYIDQSNIGYDDLGDAIHVNGRSGNNKLCANIFKQLYTYTPPISRRY